LEGITPLPSIPYQLTHVECYPPEFSIVFWIYPKPLQELSISSTAFPLKALLYKGENKAPGENVTAVYFNNNFTLSFVITTTSGQRYSQIKGNRRSEILNRSK
jgi:hypothetical protein